MAVAYKAVLQYNETLKENTLVAVADIGEERSKSSRRKLQNTTDGSKENVRSKERITSREKYSTRNNETEDRKYQSNRNNKKQKEILSPNQPFPSLSLLPALLNSCVRLQMYLILCAFSTQCHSRYTLGSVHYELHVS